MDNEASPEELFSKSSELARRSSQLIRLIRQVEKLSETDLPSLYAELAIVCSELAETQNKFTKTKTKTK